jgi:hypothetical protein
LPKETKFYSAEDIGKLFLITDRWVRELTRRKVLKQVKRGLYDLVPTVQAYVSYLNQRVQSGDAEEETGDGLAIRKLRAETEEKEAKARKARYQADVMEGKLLKLEEVERQWMGRYIELKAAMLEFPKRVAFCFTDPDVRLLVEEEANAFVVELLERYSRDGIFPADDAVGASDTASSAKASASDDGQRVGKRKQNSRQ